MNRRVWILLGAILIATFIVYLFPVIPQSEAYHNFADKRAFFGVPNFLNVASNALFLLVGLPGMWFMLSAGTAQKAFIDPQERWPYFAFFVGVTLTAFGSAWYHLNPNDATLIWDRLPMMIGFMALVAAVAGERISPPTGLGLALLIPLILLGVASVLVWAVRNDLRPYAIAQFGSLLVLVLLIALFPARYTRTPDFAISLVLYGIAKFFELADRAVFSVMHVVSGHTIKHIFAALSAFWILRMLRLRAPINA